MRQEIMMKPGILSSAQRIIVKYGKSCFRSGCARSSADFYVTFIFGDNTACLKHPPPYLPNPECLSLMTSR
jgi:hypothetical protein